MIGELDNAPKANSFGTVTGTANGIRFPQQNILLVRFKASPNNSILAYIGILGNELFPLDIGDDTGWIFANDLSDFSYKGTGTHIHYWAQA